MQKNYNMLASGQLRVKVDLATESILQTNVKEIEQASTIIINRARAETRQLFV